MQASDLLFLLDLTRKGASVQDRAALAAFLEQQVQPTFGFRQATVMVQQGGQPPRYLVGGSEATPTARANEDSLYDWLVQRPAARKLQLTELLAVAPDSQELHQRQHEGVAELFGAVLRIGSQPIGLISFYYGANELAKKQLPLFHAVVDLLAGVVANVLVQEQVEKLQQRLLEPVRAGRTREAVAQAVSDAFRALLPFDASCLVAYDEAQGYDWFSLGDLPPAVTQEETVRSYYPELRPRPDLQADAGRAAWLAEPPIKYFDHLHMQAVSDRREYPILRAMLRAGAQESLFVHLRVGTQPVGALHLYSFRAGHFAPYAPLFSYLERLLYPIATGVSNVLSYEALQAADQEKALQLAVGQTLMTTYDWTELFGALARQLGSMVAWDFFAAARLSDMQTVLCLRKDRAGKLLPPENLEALRDAASLDEVSFYQALQALRPVFSEASVFGGEAYRALCAGNRLLEVARRLYGLQSVLFLPVPLAGGEAVVLTLGSRQPFALGEDTLALLRRLRPQLALALQNQAAFAEIVQLKQQLEQEKTYLVEEINTEYNFAEIVGSSTALHAVFRSVDQVAPTDTTVLILGETGTGKELIARALHHRSPRRERVLVKVNCASLPAQLIESELFGHEKGAFTGAVERRIGKFELAHRGTIFLDEIGELPLELQAKLLRVLQEREIERLGGSKVIGVDVRVLAATNRVLADEVAAGRFRADLYYRLNVFPIALPPLRQRPEDIAALADYFGQRFARRMGRPYRGLHPGCLAQLLAYPWPGNVRELENVVEHAVIVSNGQPLECEVPTLPRRPFNQESADPPPPATSQQLRADRDQWERERLEAVLHQTHWRIRGADGAAAVLNLKPTTLEARLKRLGIK